MKLKDKVIIVTGGNGLIGKHIVENIKEHGGIAINFDISAEDNIENNSLKCDVSDKDSIISCVEKVYEKFGRIDGLVNSAYPRTKNWGNKFEDIDFSSWQKNVDMQMNTTFLICQKVLAIMKKQGSGSIVNFGSTYGVKGNDFTIYEGTSMTSPAAYSAIKGGIINFTRYLASYFGQYSIRVNCVSPGGIFDNQNPIFVKNYSHRSPLKRMGKSHEIAPAVSFLLSEEASFVTGHNLIVDGGWCAV